MSTICILGNITFSSVARSKINHYLIIPLATRVQLDVHKKEFHLFCNLYKLQQLIL